MEIFDAYDQFGNAMGYDLVRGSVFPNGAYHKVVQIYTFDNQNQLLITKRHPNKIFGSMWEVTAGSVIKGESELEGAIRELHEETGLEVNEHDLILFDQHIERDCIWYTYLTKLSIDTPFIRYQEHETIDHRWISLEIFHQELNLGVFPEPMKVRHQKSYKNFLQHLSSLGIML